MLDEHYPYYLANVPESPNADLAVTDKYIGKIATRVALADHAAIDTAISGSLRGVGDDLVHRGRKADQR